MDNKYGVYRQIRFERTNRTLGKMTWWRVALGLALLISVLFISGFIPVRLASSGHFKTAEKLMVKSWMETYRPGAKAYIEAGVLFEEGDYAAALAGFEQAEQLAADRELDAVVAMRSLTALKLAQTRLDARDTEGAREALASVAPDHLAAEDAAIYETLTVQLDPG